MGLSRIKKGRLAGWLGAIPVVVFGLLTKSMFLPMGWNSDEFTHHTLEPSAFPNHEVTVQVHCPHLDDDATLHLCIYPFIEGESEMGLPMQRLGEGQWDVTFRYPTTPFVFNYNLGDRKQAAMVKWHTATQRDASTWFQTPCSSTPFQGGSTWPQPAPISAGQARPSEPHTASHDRFGHRVGHHV